MNENDKQMFHVVEKTQGETEEAILNLEIYVECLNENVMNFKKILDSTFFEIQEFMLEYINLEEKILNIFEELDRVKLTKELKMNIDGIVIQFNLNWRDFQDVWDDQMWEIYESTRKNEMKINLAHLKETTYSIEEEIKNISSDSTVVKDNKDGASDKIEENKAHSLNLSTELKNLMRNYKSNQVQSPNNLKVIDEDLLNLITSENIGYKNKLHFDSKKERNCFNRCCLIF